MKRKKLLFKLLPVYGLTILVVMLAILALSLSGIKDLNDQHTRSQLFNTAKLILENIKVHENPNYQEICLKAGELTSNRITIISKDGTVLGDSEENPSAMENHLDRPEVKAALKNENGYSIRFSHTLNKEMLYVTFPVNKIGNENIIVRTSTPIKTIRELVSPHFKRLVSAALILILSAIMVNYFVTNSITGPLKVIKSGAENLAKGNFKVPFPNSQVSEFDDLSKAIEDMAEQLEKRLNIISNQHNEQQAVLSSMIEGVIAFNSSGKLIRINDSALEFLSERKPGLEGRTIQEIIRNKKLLSLVTGCLKSKVKVEEEIEILGVEPKYLMVHGSPMFQSDGKFIGVTIVLNDITRLKILENHRKEFVGNVAHELKTPLTSIKGFVETLQSENLKDMEEAQNFLDIIGKQANRLNTIIDDLLTLSKLEELRESGGIEKDTYDLSQLIKTAISEVKSKADEKRMKIAVACNEGVEVSCNMELFISALMNLLDNAVKYCEKETLIEVVCDKSNDHVQIQVKDNGPGIPREHTSRLFERFYRVDKGRSRKEGGTGLGLSIVKHIILAHRGSIDVNSKVGQGSTFTIKLPL